MEIKGLAIDQFALVYAYHCQPVSWRSTLSAALITNFALYAFSLSFQGTGPRKAKGLFELARQFLLLFFDAISGVLMSHDMLPPVVARERNKVHCSVGLPEFWFFIFKCSGSSRS